MKIEFYQDLHNKTVVLGGDHHAQSMVDVIEKDLRRRNLSVERVPFTEDTKDYIAQTIAVAEKVSAGTNLTFT